MRRRTGFTLVEMMVSMALVLFIMVILSQAFVAGLESFRLLKATGDMQERLRTVSSILRQDLASNHFLPGGGARSLSGQDLTSGTWAPPLKGFFRIWQGSAPSTTNPSYFDEGPDGDGTVMVSGVPAIFNHSFRAIDHQLHFTITSSGNRLENYFSGTVPIPPAIATTVTRLDQLGPSDFQSTGSYNAQWAQVAYFLRATGASANGTPLFGLYRRQVAILADPDATAMNNAMSPPRPPYSGAATTNAAFLDQTYYDVSCKADAAGNLFFQTSADVTIPQLRFGTQIDATSAGIPVANVGSIANPIYTYPKLDEQVTGTNSSHFGDDLLLTDVVSFEVKVLHSLHQNEFVSLFDASVPNGYNSAINPLNVRVFDTWTQTVNSTYDYSGWNSATSSMPSNTAIPMKINILALQITVRVWDAKSQQTRQITIIQDM
jgi:prepilin-type N-terminal cleavage/methylation domain-containing protein